MVAWHHRLIGQRFEQTLGDSEGQGSRGCCSPWGHKEPDTTERMNHKIFLQRRHVHVQQAHEEMFNVLNHHTHANESHSGIEIGHHQKEHRYEIVSRMESTGNLRKLRLERKLV